jgi:CRISPR-associated protein Csm2
MDLSDPVGSAEEINRAGKEWGEHLASRNLKNTQIRGVFGQVRVIELNWPVGQKGDAARSRLILLKPKLAYQAKRIPELEPLRQILVQGIDEVKDRATFQRFVEFFEAVVAYHRAAER